MDQTTTSIRLVAVAAIGAAWLVATPARAQIVVYCGVDEDWCRGMVTEFTKETGIRTDMTRMSNGEIYAKLRAEKDNPRGDIWWGGTGDPHLQAADDGLTESYISPTLPQLRDWARKYSEVSKGRTVGVYLGALGFGYNTEELASKKLAAPACWADLIKPEYHGEVQMADPNSSGTAWTALATFVQLWGEDAAFDYLKKLHHNINEYTKAGAAPALAMGRGETMVGIVFQHDIIAVAKTGKPVKVVSPCEGTGYEIGAMSLIKGARHMDDAKKFYEWALTPAAQALAPHFGSFQLPSNSNLAPPPESPDLSKIKLINYDSAKFGSAAVRDRLLKRFNDEVKSQAR